MKLASPGRSSAVNNRELCIPLGRVPIDATDLRLPLPSRRSWSGVERARSGEAVSKLKTRHRPAAHAPSKREEASRWPKPMAAASFGLRSHGMILCHRLGHQSGNVVVVRSSRYLALPELIECPPGWGPPLIWRGHRLPVPFTGDGRRACAGQSAALAWRSSGRQISCAQHTGHHRFPTGPPATKFSDKDRRPSCAVAVQ